jgi:hypothetical protein
MPAHPETGYNSSEYELRKKSRRLRRRKEEHIKVANHRIEDLERKGE